MSLVLTLHVHYGMHIAVNKMQNESPNYAVIV